MPMYELKKNTEEMKIVTVNGKEEIIPESWNVNKIDDIFNIIDGDRGKNYPQKKELLSEGYCLFLDAKNFDKMCKFKNENNLYINKDKYEKMRKGVVKTNDMVLTTRGTIGKIVLISDKEISEHKNIRINSGMVIIRLKEEKKYLNMNYYRYVLYNLDKQLKKSGGVIPQITTHYLKSYCFPNITNKNEQQKIAEHLSFIEDTIFKTETLIAEKEKEFRYYSRELLSGNLRVKKDNDGNIQFYNNEHWKNIIVNKKEINIPEDWNVISLSDYNVSVKTGKLDTNQANLNGKYPFFSCSIHQKLFVDEYGFDGESILVTGNGDPGSVRYYNGKFDAYQRTYVLQGGNNMLFLKQYMSYNFKKGITKLGSVISYIKIDDFNNYRFLIPSHEDEQTLISSILQDSEKEIEKYKELLEALKLRLKGDMQKLLTGSYILGDRIKKETL